MNETQQILADILTKLDSAGALPRGALCATMNLNGRWTIWNDEPTAMENSFQGTVPKSATGLMEDRRFPDWANSKVYVSEILPRKE